MEDKKLPTIGRRKLLRTIGAGTVLGAGGLSTFTGTAAAWDRKDVYFKGCSEVWLVVGADDVAYDPPTVVRVVVALADGTLECRDIELTPENTTTIPGKHGDAPVRKVVAGDGEKVLSVIFYNYRRDSAERFSSASCIHTNDNRCAQTPETPSLDDATCVEEARQIGGYDCSTSVSTAEGAKSKQKDDSSKGGKPF